MTDIKKQAIDNYFIAIEILKSEGVIRSDSVFGDIGEYLCTLVFTGLALVKDKTNEGYDAEDGEKKIQIKFSNSKDTKNIDLGEPSKYDSLIVVLGKQSAHRNKDDTNHEYLFYRYTSEEVIENFKVNSGYKLSKTKHFKTADKQYPKNTIQ